MLTMRLQHHQGCSETPKCAYVIYGQPLITANYRHQLLATDTGQLTSQYIADTVKLKLRVDYYGDWCRCLVWPELWCTLDILQ